MAHRPRDKMPMEKRAAQFMPFSALDGLDSALRAKERVTVPRPALSEEQARTLDRRIRLLKKGQLATVTYHKDHGYVQITGTVSRLDLVHRTLQIVRTTIAFDDILDITGAPYSR